MRFLLTVHDFRSVNGYTLAPRQLALALQAKGHEIRFLCVYKPAKLLEGESEANFLATGVNPFTKSGLIAKYQPEVVITNGNSPVDVVALEYAKKNKIFTVSYIHSRYDKALEHRYLPWGKYWPDDIKEGIAEVLLQQFQAADIVVALSEDMRRHLERYFAPEKIKIISNGIDLQRFVFQKRAVDALKPVNLLYVANLEKRKNHIFLLQMLQFLPKNYVLHIVGGKEEPDYSLLFKKALNRSIEKGLSVIYHGKVAPEQMIKLYEQAHVFVNPSLMEAQSVVLLEAIAVGLPIVRFYGENTSGVTEHAKTALHVPELSNPQEFAGSVRLLTEHPAIYAKLRQGQKEKRQDFSSARAAEVLLKLIKAKRV